MRISTFVPTLLLSLFMISCSMNPAEQTESLSVTHSFASGLLLDNATEDPLGNSLTYPEGDPAVTTAMAVWQPGFETGWHYHPYFGSTYILQGELTVNYDLSTPTAEQNSSKSATRQETYTAGDTFLATPNTWHYSANNGDEELIFMISWIGVDGQPVRVDE